MATREEILRAHPLEDYCRKHGRELVKSGQGYKTNCFLHDDKHPSMSVDGDRWYCHVCGVGGSVIDLVSRTKGWTIKETMKAMGEGLGSEPEKRQRRAIDPKKFVLVDTYDYRDEQGRVSYCVDRMEFGTKKKFMQYVVRGGKKVYSLDGVQRVLWRLPEVLKGEEVCLAEGEKCVSALVRMGFNGSCNSGGSKAWLPAYAEYLQDKHVVILPDSDKPGEEWLEAIMESIRGKVASSVVVRMPPEINDVADLAEAKGDEAAAEHILKTIEASGRIQRGLDVDIYSSHELYSEYKSVIRSYDNATVNLAKWLPALKWPGRDNQGVRPLVPGEIGIVLAATGTGKTAILQNVALSLRPQKVLLFELELPGSLLFERFTSNVYREDGYRIEDDIRNGKEYDPSLWDHIYTCPRSEHDAESIKKTIELAELKMGEKPSAVLIDYVGLMSGQGRSRYERVSAVSEAIKRIAKATNTVIIMASQVHRKEPQEEVGLTDGKDSGSLENSCGLVIGAWKLAAGRMQLKILKNTKGRPGLRVECDFRGAQMRITQAVDDPPARKVVGVNDDTSDVNPAPEFFEE